MASKIERDFHGLTVEEASRQLHQIISNVRSSIGLAHVFLIVGHGPIRDKMFEIYREYGIDAYPDLGNAGVIVAVVE
jgi:DNA-nicking Smr family endonuclease